MAEIRPDAAGKASIVVEFRSRESEDDHRTDRAFWTALEDFAALLSSLSIFEGTGADVFVEFGRIAIRSVDLAALRRKLAGPADVRQAELDRLRQFGETLLEGLDRAVVELRRRDRRSGRAEDPLADELEGLLS